MNEWWSYRPGSFLLFSARTYYRLIETANAEWWPLHLLFGLAGAAVLGWMARRHRGRHERWRECAACAVLGVAWLWVAWGFQHRRFAEINWSADYAALLFAAQGLALLGLGALRNGIALRHHASALDPIAATVVGVGLLVYPLIPVIVGRPLAQAEAFGVMPAPTVIATLGFLLWAEPPRRWLLVVPVAACLAEGAMLWALRAGEVWVAPAAAVVAVACVAWRRRRRR